MPNRFKDRLTSGSAQFGSFASLCSPLAAEALACHGFDFVLADLEHAQNDISTLVGLLQGIEAGGSEPVVRVPWNDLVWIKRVMDAGGRSIMVPFVQSPDEALRAARAMRYPPDGDRGVAMVTRASRFGARPDYAAKANGEACLIVQAETAHAVDQIAAIARVPGVDAVFIGPSDLAASMGHTGNIQHPDVRAKIADGLTVAKRAKVPIGCLGTSPAECIALKKQGFDFVLLGTDLGMLVRQIKSDVAALAADGWTPGAPRG